MRKWLTLLCLLALGGVAHAQAPVDFAGSGHLTVVELFTSQGCASCPPADAALRSLRDRPGILTLSWPVDYWNRLGWEDTFAAPGNAVRQAAYNKRLGRGGVFTPQMIFDGRIQCVGSKPEKIRTAIEKSRAVAEGAVAPVLRTTGNALTLSLPETELAGPVAVRVVWFLADADVEIGDGENRGRLLHYTNVVRHSDMLEDWTGEARTIVLDPEAGRAAGADHVAILLQEGYGHGPIVGATSLALTMTPKVIHASMP